MYVFGIAYLLGLLTAMAVAGGPGLMDALREDYRRNVAQRRARRAAR